MLRDTSDNTAEIQGWRGCNIVNLPDWMRYRMQVANNTPHSLAASFFLSSFHVFGFVCLFFLSCFLLCVCSFISSVCLSACLSVAFVVFLSSVLSVYLLSVCLSVFLSLLIVCSLVFLPSGLASFFLLFPLTLTVLFICFLM